MVAYGRNWKHAQDRGKPEEASKDEEPTRVLNLRPKRDHDNDGIPDEDYIPGVGYIGLSPSTLGLGRDHFGAGKDTSPARHLWRAFQGWRRKGAR